MERDKEMTDMIYAADGKIFTLTVKGQRLLPATIVHEREAGEPVRGCEYCVPLHWLTEGYVVEEYEL